METTNESKTLAGDVKVKEEVKDEGLKFDAESLTNMIVNNKDEVAVVMKNIAIVSDYVQKAKKRKGSVLRYLDDKIFVIAGVVGIAVAAIFLIPDPTNILMSIISGLFGLATGRAMDNSKDNDE